MRNETLFLDVGGGYEGEKKIMARLDSVCHLAASGLGTFGVVYLAVAAVTDVSLGT